MKPARICFSTKTTRLIGIHGVMRRLRLHGAWTGPSFFLLDIPRVTGAMLWLTNALRMNLSLER